MAAKKQAASNWLHSGVLHLSLAHFIFVFVYVAAVIAFDGWKLLTPESIRQRWIAAMLLLGVVTFVWYSARNNGKTTQYYKNLAYLLIASDIAIATFSVYTQRGMASRGVMLFAVAITASAALQSKKALLATAAFSTAAYVTAATKYFFDNPSEGYKAELYGEVGFYCGIFFVLTAILWTVVRARRN